MLQNRTMGLPADPKLRLLDRLMRECYTENTSHSEIYALESGQGQDGLWCPRTFDGFACWDETPAAVTVYQPCPEFVIGFDATRFAFKRCRKRLTTYHAVT